MSACSSIHYPLINWNQMGNSSSGEVCGCCVPVFDRVSIGDSSATAVQPPVVRTIRLERNEVYHFDMTITPQIRDELRKKVDGMVALIEVDIHVDEGELKQAFMVRCVFSVEHCIASLHYSVYCIVTL
jgi:hypothetical protein